jgi:glycosyltransferase involved in cell wall biosynthesis
VVESAAVVILNTSRALEAVRFRYRDLPSDKFRVIPNGYDPTDFESLADRNSSATPSPGSSGPLRIVHTGAFYGKRNVDALIHAIGDLVVDGRIGRDDLRVELIGAARGNRSRESDLAASRGISDVVRALPRVPHDECLRQMADADLLLLVQTEAPLCIPGKLYEYIAIGRPILTLSADGATADVVAEYSLGQCVDPSDPESLRGCLALLVQQHRTGGIPMPKGSAIPRFDGKRQMLDFDKALRDAIAASAHESID